MSSTVTSFCRSTKRLAPLTAGWMLPAAACATRDRAVCGDASGAPAKARIAAAIPAACPSCQRHGQVEVSVDRTSRGDRRRRTVGNERRERVVVAEACLAPASGDGPPFQPPESATNRVIDTPRAAAGVRHDVHRVDAQPPCAPTTTDFATISGRSASGNAPSRRRARPRIDDRRDVDSALQRQCRRIRCRCS